MLITQFRFKCLRCSRGNSYCEHTNHLSCVSEDGFSDIMIAPTTTSKSTKSKPKVYICHSIKKYNESPTARLQPLINQEVAQIKLTLDVTHCTNCHSTNILDKKNIKNGFIFDSFSFEEREVPLKICGSCGFRFYYDGYDEGVININNKYLFTYRTIQMYLKLWLNSTLTFHSYWISGICSMYYDNISAEKLKPLNYVRNQVILLTY